jgi:hypothetical protein
MSQGMSRYRRAAKVDLNQAEIVRQLRQVPCLTVACGHDDILVGFRGRTYWLEVKRPGQERRLTDSEKRLRDTWQGHWQVVSTLDEALTAVGIGGE